MAKLSSITYIDTDIDMENIYDLKFLPSVNNKTTEQKESTSAKLPNSFMFSSLSKGLMFRGKEYIDDYEKGVPLEDVIKKIFTSSQKDKESFMAIQKDFVDVDLEELSSNLSSLSTIYSFRKTEQSLLSFFMNNAQLMPFLKEADKKIRDYFPSEELILDIVSDPENSNRPELVILIHTSLSSDEAINKLSLLDQNWWLDVSSQISEKMFIHVEF